LESQARKVEQVFLGLQAHMDQREYKVLKVTKDRKGLKVL
jgi:hypothetical protein